MARAEAAELNKYQSGGMSLPIVPVLDADIVTDAHRLLNRALGMHQDTPVRCIPAYISFSKDDVCKLDGDWWVTRAPQQRHLLILGQFEHTHHDRLGAAGTEKGKHEHELKQNKGQFAVLLRVANTAMYYVKVRAPAAAFAGTILDGDIVPHSDGRGWNFEAHDMLAADGMPLLLPRSAIDLKLSSIAASIAFDGSCASTVQIRPWVRVGNTKNTLNDGLFAKELRVIDVVAPSRDMGVLHASCRHAPGDGALGGDGDSHRDDPSCNRGGNTNRGACSRSANCGGDDDNSGDSARNRGGDCNSGDDGT